MVGQRPQVRPPGDTNGQLMEEELGTYAGRIDVDQFADEPDGHVQERVVTPNTLARPELTTGHVGLLEDTGVRTKVVPVAPLLSGGHHPLAKVGRRLTGVEMHTHVDPVVSLG